MFDADHTISRRAPDPSSRPSDPFLHLEGRESTLNPRNEKTASSLDPPTEGREVKREGKHYETLRQGWVCSKRTCVFSGIQFTRHCIEFVVVETKQIVSSNSHVILTRQTCGQRSGMVAEANAERQHFIFTYESVICSQCRNIEYSRV